jgi:uncharacterized protein (DUF1684 family)
MRGIASVGGLLCALVVQAQPVDRVWADGLEAYWDRINAEYRDTAHSPLLPEDLAVFTELDRYAPDPQFRILARYHARKGKPFGMRTSTDRLPLYESVGVLSFRINGVKEHLTVYRNIELSKRPEYADHLFVPFTDLTNGGTTYGGGRYLDLEAPLGKEVEVDLNRAYNPYCAYGGRYSCPVPPMENHLEVHVEAGVKAFGPAGH